MAKGTLVKRPDFFYTFYKDAPFPVQRKGAKEGIRNSAGLAARSKELDHGYKFLGIAASTTGPADQIRSRGR